MTDSCVSPCPHRFASSFLICVLLGTLSLIVPADASAQTGGAIFCRDFGANPNDWTDDAVFLQNCLNSAPSGSTVYLDPGSPGYVLDAHRLTFSANNLTITSSQAPTRATIIAGPNLSQFLLEQPDIALTFYISYISFDGRVDEPGWRAQCNGNVFLRGKGFHFAHNEVHHSCIGMGLGISGSRYQVFDNYIAYNGKDRYAAGAQWSDGITALSCFDGSITNNVFVDNTDIDLVVGGGPNCNVQGNTIWHGGKYAFAGLNVGNFVDSGAYAGRHEGSLFSGNTVTNVEFNRLGHGFSVGSHPWPDGVDLWIVDTGTVTGNTISGANVNLLIEGFGVFNPATGHVSAGAGTISGNDARDDAMGNSDCANAYRYAVNPSHAVGSYDGGYSVLVWDGVCSG
jgi:hypothetical protein